MEKDEFKVLDTQMWFNMAVDETEVFQIEENKGTGEEAAGEEGKTEDEKESQNNSGGWLVLWGSIRIEQKINDKILHV